MNIAARISDVAAKFPHKKSVVFSERHGLSYQYPSYSFQEFEERSNQMANAFIRMGISRGMGTLLFVKPCLDFSIITFALFKIGAIPVLIDPGMGIKNLLSSIRQVKPEAMVSIGKVHWIRRLLKKHFVSIKIKVSLDKVGGSTHHLYKKLNQESKLFPIVSMNDDEYAAILFTSGGTGIPKGVLYTHGILNFQTESLQGLFRLNENHTDLPGFPLFALFTLAMGMTSVIPDLDPTKPASCDPQKIVQNILDNQVTFVAGSPAIWERVGRYCLEKKIQLASIKQVVMFGAPVRHEIHEMYKKILPFGDTYTPYGATECLPVSLISGTEVLKDKKAKTLTGAGTCIGTAIPKTQIGIINASDIPESVLSLKPQGTIGEIVVCGPQVTPAYFEMDEETKKAKIHSDGKLWHRMGDVGYLDADGQLWFLGRKTHVVKNQETGFYPIQVEAIFNQHPEVKRSALVKLEKDSKIVPGLVIERWDKETILGESFLQELKQLAQKTKTSAAVHEFFLHSGFPVDVRHNIKIDRVALSRWAQHKG